MVAEATKRPKRLSAVGEKTGAKQRIRRLVVFSLEGVRRSSQSTRPAGSAGFAVSVPWMRPRC